MTRFSSFRDFVNSILHPSVDAEWNFTSIFGILTVITIWFRNSINSNLKIAIQTPGFWRLDGTHPKDRGCQNVFKFQAVLHCCIWGNPFRLVVMVKLESEIRLRGSAPIVDSPNPCLMWAWSLLRAHNNRHSFSLFHWVFKYYNNSFLSSI